MANSVKTVRIPVATHGLHPHPYNYPYLGTARFMQAFPVYWKELYIGEKDHPKGGLFSRLNPTTGPSFVTGRYSFKSFFVPYSFVWTPWYHFDQGLPFKKTDGTYETFSKAPYCLMENLNKAFIADDRNCEVQSNPQFDDNGKPSNFDFTWFVGQNNYTDYRCLTAGTEVLKILNGLGISPTWTPYDKTEVCILPLLCYIRLMLDYFYPGQYVGSLNYQGLENAIQTEKVVYDQNDMTRVLRALRYLAQIYYDKSFFDCAFDNPLGPQTGVSVNPQTIVDPSIYDGDPSAQFHVSDGNLISSTNVDDSSVAPYNAPSIQNSSQYTEDDGFKGRITQFSLNALSSIANYMRRKQLAGSRLIDSFLAERGVHLGKLESKTAFYLGERDVEINIDAVENNSNENLGELAGKGVAATDPQKPLEFSCESEHDGLFIIVCSVVPDCELPVYNHPLNLAVNQMQRYHASYDKVGVAVVPQCCVHNSWNGANNKVLENKIFGFGNMYFQKLVQPVTLTGDFRLHSKGSESLQALHSFRLFDDANVNQNNGIYHSLDFIAGYSDSYQYQRLFYSSAVDNFILFIRWFGQSELQKLPLGDSFDWDDDEYNKKVEIVNQGMKG